MQGNENIVIGGAEAAPTQPITSEGDIVLRSTSNAKSKLKRNILLSMGGLALIGAAVFVGHTMQQMGGITKELIREAFDGHVNSLIELEDAFAELQTGSQTANSLLVNRIKVNFFSRRVSSMKEVCDKVCGYDHVSFGGDEVNAAFLDVRDGLIERSELYSIYVENYVKFYDVFAEDFRDFSPQYVVRDEVNELLSASDSRQRNAVVEIRDYLVRRAEIVGSITMHDCLEDRTSEACSALWEGYHDNEKIVNDTSLAIDIFFGSGDKPKSAEGKPFGNKIIDLLFLVRIRDE